MRRLMLRLALAGLAFWTLLCLGLWALFASAVQVLHWLFGGEAATVFALFEGLGGALIFAGWAVGAGIAVVLAILFARLRTAQMIVIRADAGLADPPMRDVTPRDPRLPGRDP